MARRLPITALVLIGIAAAGDDSPLKSGLQVGETVSQFYVRAVTGPLRGKSVCYVCRNGDRPVVMVFSREIDAELRELLKGLDASVDRHRADGLRCFGVFVAASGRELGPQLQTVSFDEKLSVPLTLAVAAAEGPAGQKLDPDAAVTVVLYRDLTVVGNFAYRKGGLDQTARSAILRSVEKLAAGEPLQISPVSRVIPFGGSRAGLSPENPIIRGLGTGGRLVPPWSLRNASSCRGVSACLCLKSKRTPTSWWVGPRLAMRPKPWPASIIRKRMCCGSRGDRGTCG